MVLEATWSGERETAESVKRTALIKKRTDIILNWKSLSDRRQCKLDSHSETEASDRNRRAITALIDVIFYSMSEIKKYLQEFILWNETAQREIPFIDLQITVLGRMLEKNPQKGDRISQFWWVQRSFQNSYGVEHSRTFVLHPVVQKPETSQ